MSLLPDVERELLRVARLQRPDATRDAVVGERSRERSMRVRLSAAAFVAFALLGLATGALFLSGLHTHRSLPTAGRPPAHTSTGFPGAPHTQPNSDGVATGFCPLAARNEYLPPRSGCVTSSACRRRR